MGQAIEVGQFWRERGASGRTARVDEVDPLGAWGRPLARLTVTAPAYTDKRRRKLVMNGSTLLALWDLVDPNDPRRIALPIAGAAATHCGTDSTNRCRLLISGEECPVCAVFPSHFEYDEEEPDKPPARLPACLAAEVRP